MGINSRTARAKGTVVTAEAESQPTDSKFKNEEATSWGSATTIATTSTKKAKGSILLQTADAIATNESPFPYEFCSTMAVNAHT